MMVIVPEIKWQYNLEKDTKDGKPWSEMDIDDLRGGLAQGWTIEKTARFLCRFRSQDDVRRKAEELGLISER
jgi:hypothetical protein